MTSIKQRRAFRLAPWQWPTTADRLECLRSARLDAMVTILRGEVKYYGPSLHRPPADVADDEYAVGAEGRFRAARMKPSAVARPDVPPRRFKPDEIRVHIAWTAVTQ